MKNIWQDLRSGVRFLLKAPGYTATIVMILALGIGANGAIFSVAKALLLQPAPFRDAHRLMMVYETRSPGFNREPVSAANFLEWRAQNKVFEHIAAYQGWRTNITGVADPERVQGLLASPSFFRALGVAALTGRTFSQDEENVGSNHSVVLSHEFWQRRFGGAAGVIGNNLELDGQAFTIIGVMPPNFDFPIGGSDLYAPLALTPARINNRDTHDLEVLARLKTEASEAQAHDDLTAIAKTLAQQYPQTNSDRGVNLIPINKALVGKFTSGFIFILFGAVIFVLLIACANVGNLQIVRAVQREKEMAIRAALGASRWRILRQLLIEGLLLSLICAVAGLALAAGGVYLIRASIPPDITRFIAGWKGINIDGSALGFIAITSLLAVVISALAPALQSSTLNLSFALKEGSGAVGRSRSRNRLRNLLVITQVALALALSVGSALMVKGFKRMLDNQRRGFDQRGVLTMRLMLPARKYAEPQQMTEFYDRFIQLLGTVPGVEAAGLVRFLPSSGERSNSRFIIEGQPEINPRERPFTDLQVISSNYFQSLRIPLLRGRQFTERDNAEAPPVTIISESMARRFFPNQDPIGQRIKFETPELNSRPVAIIGVVGDVRNFILDREHKPLIYLPYPQFPGSSMSVVLRASNDRLNLITAVRQQVRNLDPDQPLFQIKTMDQVIADAASGIRVVSVLMAILGTLALTLAAVGVYSVMAYSVSQRAHEIGVRMALGAQRRDVIWLVLRHALKLTVIGLLIGAPLAFAMGRAMLSLVFGVVALDILTFGGFILGLAAIAVLASYLPVRKATRINPITALRYE